MEKRYQVFVSSTYEDLQVERQEVMHALLELDCIPSGMELFPAASEDQWTVIQAIIDECDYYVVIVAGKYGSVEASSGQSYTEKEYRYALAQGKPIIAFLHKEPNSLRADRTEQDPEMRKNLENFRTLCRTKLCKFWDSPADLGSVVSRSIVQLKKSHPAVGWVRGNLVPDEGAASEILRLRKRIETLEAQLTTVSTKAPEGTETLAGGEDQFDIQWTLRLRDMRTSKVRRFSTQFETCWNDIFAAISPLLINEASEETIKDRLATFVFDHDSDRIREDKSGTVAGFSVSEDSFQTIKVQLRALGLITRSTRQRSLKDLETYWTLTPYGDGLMNQLLAIGRR